MNAHRSFRSATARHLKSRLLEVIPFASGLLQRHERDSAVADVAGLGDNGLLARTFLETKLYDHNCFKEFVTSEKASSLGTPEADWNEAWLRGLHLFNVVLRDAESCAVHLPTNFDSAGTADFFRSLVSRQQDSLHKILTAYAEQDAAVAFRLAEISNLDLPTMFPDIVVANCDQKPFFALVCRNGADEVAERVWLWASLLASAGLRNPLIARWLRDRPEEESWTSAIDSIPKAQRWSLLGKQNLFMQCLTITANYEGTPIDSVTRIVKAIPPPSKFLLVGTLGALLTSAAFLVILLLTFFSSDLIYLGSRLQSSPLRNDLGARYHDAPFNSCLYSTRCVCVSGGNLQRHPAHSAKEVTIQASYGISCHRLNRQNR